MSFFAGANFGQDTSHRNTGNIQSSDHSAMQPIPNIAVNPAFAIRSNGSFCNLSSPTYSQNVEISDYEDIDAVPEGWTKHWSNTYQRYYYFNVKTGEQNWKPAPSSATLEIRYFVLYSYRS